MLKIEGTKQELEEVKEALYKFYNDSLKNGIDIFGCEPACRNDTYNCKQCIREYIEEDIEWICKEMIFGE